MMKEKFGDSFGPVWVIAIAQILLETINLHRDDHKLPRFEWDDFVKMVTQCNREIPPHAFLSDCNVPKE